MLLSLSLSLSLSSPCCLVVLMPYKLVILNWAGDQVRKSRLSAIEALFEDGWLPGVVTGIRWVVGVWHQSTLPAPSRSHPKGPVMAGSRGWPVVRWRGHWRASQRLERRRSSSWLRANLNSET